nr:hypothetical protein [Caulerpa lentillifera]
MNMSLNFNLYGINIPELLILDEVISDLEFSLVDSLRYIILVNTIMCQICVNLNIDTRQKQKLDSISSYRKILLSKNHTFIGLCAAVSIRKTMAVYSKLDSEEIKSDFKDLVYNTTGPSNGAPRLQAILENPTKLRSHRRNIMLKTSGRLQSQSIYSPTSTHPNIASLDTNLLGEITPFESDDFLYTSKNIKTLIEKTIGDSINWSDGIKIPLQRGKNLTYLEYEIFGDQMSRIESFKIPAKPSAAKVKDAQWKKAVVNQLENLEKSIE